MPLRLDYTNMMAASIDGGISDAEWRDVGARFTKAHAAVVELHGQGTLGFLDLPWTPARLEQRNLLAQRYEVASRGPTLRQQVSDYVKSGAGVK